MPHQSLPLEVPHQSLPPEVPHQSLPLVGNFVEEVAAHKGNLARMIHLAKAMPIIRTRLNTTLHMQSIVMKEPSILTKRKQQKESLVENIESIYQTEEPKL